MNRQNRLTSSREFKRLFTSGKRAFVDDVMCVAEMSAVPAPPRFGFVVTKKAGGAVQRNRVKRLLREAVRPAVEQVKPGTTVVIMARGPMAGKSLAQIRQAVSAAMRKVGAL